MKRLISMLAIFGLMFATTPVFAAVSISNATVVPDSLVKNTVTNLSVTFTTPVDIPVDGKISVVFPIYFSITGVTGATSAVVDGGLTHLKASFTELQVVRDGDGAVVPSGTLIDDLVIYNITTPPITDYVGNYTVMVLDASNNILASGSASGQTFVTEQIIPTGPAYITLENPNGGEIFTGDDVTTVSWLSSQLNENYRLELSTNGGSSYQIIADDISTKQYTWTIPNIDVSQGKIRIYAIDSNGNDSLSDISDANFKIVQTEEVVDTSDGDLSALHGVLIKGESMSAVYFLGADAKRYVFPSEAVFYSWYSNFDDVVTISDEDLASFKLGSRITMAPGSLIKVMSDPKVYVIDTDGSKRHVTSEAVAKAQFGIDWASDVVDIDVTQWFDYPTGEVVDELVGTFTAEKGLLPITL